MGTTGLLCSVSGLGLFIAPSLISAGYTMASNAVEGTQDIAHFDGQKNIKEAGISLAVGTLTSSIPFGGALTEAGQGIVKKVIGYCASETLQGNLPTGKGLLGATASGYIGAIAERAVGIGVVKKVAEKVNGAFGKAPQYLAEKAVTQASGCMAGEFAKQVSHSVYEGKSELDAKKIMVSGLESGAMAAIVNLHEANKQPASKINKNPPQDPAKGLQDSITYVFGPRADDGNPLPNAQNLAATTQGEANQLSELTAKPEDQGALSSAQGLLKNSHVMGAGFHDKIVDLVNKAKDNKKTPAKESKPSAPANGSEAPSAIAKGSEAPSAPAKGSEAPSAIAKGSEAPPAPPQNNDGLNGILLSAVKVAVGTAAVAATAKVATKALRSQPPLANSQLIAVPAVQQPEQPVAQQPTQQPEQPVAQQPTQQPEQPVAQQPTQQPEQPVVQQPTQQPEQPVAQQPTQQPEQPVVQQPVQQPEQPVVQQTKQPIAKLLSQIHKLKIDIANLERTLQSLENKKQNLINPNPDSNRVSNLNICISRVKEKKEIKEMELKNKEQELDNLRNPQNF